MTKLNRKARAALIAHLDANTDYNVKTIRISRDGEISAKLCADKKPGCDDTRRFVGYAVEIQAEMVR